jgi:hypothetical protein
LFFILKKKIIFPFAVPQVVLIVFDKTAWKVSIKLQELIPFNAFAGWEKFSSMLKVYVKSVHPLISITDK